MLTVCRHVNPHEPAAVSRRQYDAARGAAGHPNLPTATQVLRRTSSRSWPELLHTLADPARDLERTLGQRSGRDCVGECSQAKAVLALRDVARSLGQRTVSAHEYETVRERVNRTSARRGLSTRLPSIGQIEHAANGWTNACRAAQLTPGPNRYRPHGMPVVDALDIAVEALGAIPSRRQLEALARHNRVALARPVLPRAEAIAQVRARRAARGLGMPKPATGWPTTRFEINVPALTAAAQTTPSHQGRWTRTDCESAVRAWLADLAPGERPTQRAYARWQARNTGFPAASALGRHGGLRALREHVTARA